MGVVGTASDPGVTTDFPMGGYQRRKGAGQGTLACSQVIKKLN